MINRLEIFVYKDNYSKFFAYLLFVFLFAGTFGCNSPNVPTSDPTGSTKIHSQEETSIPSKTLVQTPVVKPKSITPTQTAAATQIPAETPVPTATTTQEIFRTLIPVMGIEETFIDDTRMKLIEESGAYWLRRNVLLWHEVESQEGMRNWEVLSKLDKELSESSELGLEVILIVRGAPAWAQMISGSICGPILPDKLDAFADFMHELVTRYSAPPYNVRYWELGNEPDVDPALVPPDFPFGCWGDQTDPNYGGGYYAQMLKAVYPQIKAADPDAQVLVGGLLMDCNPLFPGEGRACKPTRFIEGVLADSGGEFFDGISFHAYDFYTGPYTYRNDNWKSSSASTGPVLVTKANYLRGILDTYEISDKFLINTEFGLLCGRDGSEPKCQSEEFQLSKASYAIQANANALKEGLKANVWYSLTGWRGTGLVDNEMIPYPVYDAYAFNSERLNQAVFRKEINAYAGVKGIETLRENHREWILWAVDESEHLIHLERFPPFVLYDSFGAQMPVMYASEKSNIPIGAYAPDVYEVTIKSMPTYIVFNETNTVFDPVH
ncbi:hypothetical protein ACFLUA_00020 [Chloroflexota bacterium]